MRGGCELMLHVVIDSPDYTHVRRIDKFVNQCANQRRTAYKRFVDYFGEPIGITCEYDPYTGAFNVYTDDESSLRIESV